MLNLSCGVGHLVIIDVLFGSIRFLREKKNQPIWSFVKTWFCNGVHLGSLIDKKSLTFLEGHIMNIPIKENSIIHAHAVSHKIFEILANQKAKLTLASMLNF
jgi:hypothetical protein